MANDVALTVVGNLTDDPTLRYTPSGVAVSNFSVASTPRIFKDGEWRDGDPVFVKCAMWRAPAETAVDCLRKGFRVIVTGKLQQNTWQDRDGTKRVDLELVVDEIGPSLKFAHWVKVDKRAAEEFARERTAYLESTGRKPKTPPRRSPHDPTEDEAPF